MPDWEVREWNLSNWDASSYPFAVETSCLGLWAFVSDVARWDILYRFGGIFLDTDVELVKCPTKHISRSFRLSNMREATKAIYPIAASICLRASERTSSEGGWRDRRTRGRSGSPVASVFTLDARVETAKATPTQSVGGDCEDARAKGCGELSGMLVDGATVMPCTDCGCNRVYVAS